ncbi:MAG: type III pantothenate kinase [Arenicellales bacterium WSBS_2016_MAG_OTU3]
MIILSGWEPTVGRSGGGAVRSRKDSIVIDCGTATTIDILMGSGLFVGGAITFRRRTHAQ